MKSLQIKSTLIILTTLIIGMGIGFEIGEIIVRGHFDEMNEFRQPRGFVNVFEDIIKPDSLQKPLINSILLKYHEKMEKISKEGMNKVTVLIDSMKIEIRSLLSTEQQKRFDEEMSRMGKQLPPPGDRRPPQANDRPGPPPPGLKMPPPPNDRMPRRD